MNSIPSLRFFIAILFAGSPAFGQLIVNDPVNTGINTAIQSAQATSHLEILRQWAVHLEALNHQLRRLEDQLVVQQRIRDIIGNPSAAGVEYVLRGLGADDLARAYGETLRAVQRVADASTSLRRTAEGIYQKLEDRTAMGRPFGRQPAPYRRYAALEQQAENLDTVFAQTEDRASELQFELSATIAQLRGAPTQAEVDKLNVKVAALNGQLAHLAAARRSETDKLLAQQVLNENQAAKERQDLLEKQIAEERHTLDAIGAWQRSLRLSPMTQP